VGVYAIEARAMNEKICIIGGGPSGLVLGKELKEANISYDLYESEADFGGVWNSEGASGRAYDALHLITPKSITQLPDHPMPDTYPHYPNHKLVLAYWRSIAKDFNLYENATFNTSVTKLEPKESGWDVTLSSGATKDYDLVFVCNGLQRIPMFPKSMPPGEFTGEIIHSVDYKGSAQCKDKRVLVLGGGNSGCDIAVDCVHYANEVFHSTSRGYHYQPKFIGGLPTPDWMLSLGSKFESREQTLAYIKQVYKLAGYDGTDYGLPAPQYPLDAAHPIMNSNILYHIGHGDIFPKPGIECFDGKKVMFKDGSEATIDLLICATGFDRHFPFLDPKHLEWTAGGIPDTFLHIVPKHFDNLLFNGFVNIAAGFGSAAKTGGNFAKEYIKAYYGKTKGFEEFNKAKKNDKPDLGNNYYIDSYRHQWEVDLWKYLKVVNHYRDILVNT
jgi:hypothetical protein